MGNTTAKYKIRGANVRALQIYRQILQIQKEAMQNVTLDVEELFKKLIETKELDYETGEVLKSVYFSKKNEQTAETRKMASQIINSLKSGLRIKAGDGSGKIELMISEDGDLYRNPKEENYYPMEKTGLRIGIVRFLIDKYDFVSGHEIAENIGASYGTTTDAIAKINKISKRLLHLPEGKRNALILSRPRGGYKLNPLYLISAE